MGSETRNETTLELRIQLLRDLERSLAGLPEPPVHVLAAARELLMEKEAELGTDQRSG